MTSIQLNLLRYALDTLYARAGTYATRLVALDLDEKERDLLVAQHRAYAGKQALEDITTTLGLEAVPGTTEKACP